jgi:hypothetical protein
MRYFFITLILPAFIHRAAAHGMAFTHQDWI